ncbi:MAG TPA: dihydrolipoamide acetyltransferase family protein [Solirubrobacteraceae bacterium]|jgi:pyruvate dehydrogenase E2 component (dihydrolipoamide acetyltransferase)
MQKLRLARLGQTMEQAAIQIWLKDEGESIAVGESICEVETEKATVDVEATAAGELVRIVVPAGERVPVGTLLAIIADPGESLTAEQIDAAIAEESSSAGEAAAAPAQQEPATAAPSSAAAGRVRIMPKARALAASAGLDPATLSGSGPGGAITVADVEAAVGGNDDALPRVRERRELAGRARAMAEVMTRSAREIPQFFQQVTVRTEGIARQLEQARAQQTSEQAPRISFTDVILAACARAVGDCPLANASFSGDALVLYEDVNIGLAVSTPAGLIVPVIRRAQELSLQQLAVSRAELVERAREDKLTLQDVGGATITLSNLGMNGIEQGEALITPPQAAIIFIGATTERALVSDGKVEVAACLELSITYDHRVLEGASAAEFTLSVRRNLEAG